MPGGTRCSSRRHSHTGDFDAPPAPPGFPSAARFRSECTGSPGAARDQLADSARADGRHVRCSGHSAAGQGALAARRLKAVPRLRPHTLRCSPPPLCRTKSTRTQGQRRVHRSTLSRLITGKCTIRGDERAWWEELMINPMPVAQLQWTETRGGAESASTELRQSGKGRLASVLATA